MRKIVFDVETANLFQDVGTNNPADLTISLLAIYDYTEDKYSSFLENELSQLWPILSKADILIGYNSDHFDIPLLNKYYPGNLAKIKSVDLLREIKNSIGKRVRLDQVAQGTLGVSKSGHGLQALEWWKKGEIEKVKAYCIDDVKITKDLYEYALKNSKLFYKEGPAKLEIKLDTRLWEEVKETAFTQSLF
ncbi:MAG: ribonuclease H-like domain-containing protein [Patescibacteria group bacterium]|nr:ribonuclease H-like domain-containing protein [bacterium]MDZ4241091.1 ribonuclease H-like domain-containing protein [Patescibacteria group bacterium]